MYGGRSGADLLNRRRSGLRNSKGPDIELTIENVRPISTLICEPGLRVVFPIENCFFLGESVFRSESFKP